MDTQTLFRSARLSGRPPQPDAASLYDALFGPAAGGARLTADMQDWARHAVAPWTLYHAGHPVGVAGFRIGFGGIGLELSFHVLPEVAGQGLATEFVQAALDFAADALREDRFFARVAPDNRVSIRILQKAGFADAGMQGDTRLMTLTLRPRGRDRAAPGG